MNKSVKLNNLLLIWLLAVGCKPIGEVYQNAEATKVQNENSTINSNNETYSTTSIELGLKEFTSGKSIKQALSDLPRGLDSIEKLCSGPDRDDNLYLAFCMRNSKPTNITSLYSSLFLFTESFTACTAHSVSLVRNDTSVLNPRCIRYSGTSNSSQAIAVGYQRDDKTILEVAARDPQTNELNFYLIDYDLPCETTAQGCKARDYYLEEAEKNWQNLSIYTEQDLKNTTLDCLMCHQPGGPGTEKRLIMAQAEAPWTHWFDRETDCGKTLFNDFFKAHQGETRYAGTTLTNIRNTSAANFEFFVNNNGFQGKTFGNNFFDSFHIEREILNNGGDPLTSSRDNTSPTWSETYKNRNHMLFLDTFGGVHMPYKNCRQSDSTKLESYQNKMINIIQKRSTEDLPHLSTVNLSSEDDLRERGLMAPKDFSGNALLRRACMACHNSNLDQTLTRANFNAEDLEKNSLLSIAQAIRRLQMKSDDLQLMPPQNYIHLTDQERHELVKYLNEVGKKLQKEN
ncbi:MAG: c-type cytochrome [Bdellovibrionales bacterium]|nr:c-type cytochrome [Bdellovibrionales bacterium]